MYFTPADSLADYRQLRISRLAISDTWREHSDTVSIPAALEPLTAHLKGATVPQKLTVNYIVKTLSIFKELESSTQLHSALHHLMDHVTSSPPDTSRISSLRNIFTSWYILPNFVTSYVRTALTMKTAISEGRHAVHSGRSVPTFRGNLPAPYLRQKTDL